MNKNDRKISDEEQKKHLKELKYSDDVINELFPQSEDDAFLTNGQNLINGFTQIMLERKNIG
jgi:hypothetical protein